MLGRLPYRRIVGLSVIAATLLLPQLVSSVWAGVGLFGRGAVGGVHVAGDGVVSHPAIEDARLRDVVQQAIDRVPGDLERFTELRMVSLRQLEKQIVTARANMLPVPDSVRFLAGLQRIRYVLLFPADNDIVLAGPAEGWRADKWGAIVGKTTGRPVVLLEDLMLALRNREQGSMSCSIDPTAEGLTRLSALAKRLDNIGNPRDTVARIEQALGDQVISFQGLPATTHFARAMIAADFRMKRLAMDLEPSPVPGMPSYLALLPARGRGMKNSMPRWWLAPNYEPLHRDAEGLVWELRGQGVRCLTEADFVSETGERRRTGQSGAAAQKWAATMTEKFPELADSDSVFGHLRNLMDLAVVAALIAKEDMLTQVGLDLPRILTDEVLEQFHAPRRVATKASFIKKGRNWIISASGGVEINPWDVANRPAATVTLQDVRDRAAPLSDAWYWE